MKSTRRKFLRSTALGTAGLAAGAGLAFLTFPGCDSMTIEKLNSLRETARNRKRRIIMNNDGKDVNRAAEIRPINPENLLKQRTLGLIGSHVDSIFYCTGVFNIYYHRSEETELRTRNDPNIEDYLHELYELGTDPLEIMIDFGRENGIEVFWSMRMNDTHDSNPIHFFNFAQWKRDHPHCLVGDYGDKLPNGNNRWSSVNYEMPEARDKVYNILYDVCSRYDIDGVELDFFRHPVLFKQQMTGEPVTQDHCDIMTGFMQQVRDMTNNFSNSYVSKNIIRY